MQKQVSTLGNLFSRTWTSYKQRALPVLIIVMIATVFISTLLLTTTLISAFGGVLLAHFSQGLTGFVLLAVILFLLLLALAVLLIWSQTAAVALVVDADLSIIEAFQRGWEYFWPMTWVLTFLGGILATGFLFGILPGFLFLVWFSFAVFILLEEDRHGLDSLLASREYVRGYGLNTLGKLSVVWIASLLAALIPFLGQIITILLAPFFLLYMLHMYHELKEIKGTVKVQAGTGARIFWWALTVIGLVLPITGLLWGAYVLLGGDPHPDMMPWYTPHSISI